MIIYTNDIENNDIFSYIKKQEQLTLDAIKSNQTIFKNIFLKKESELSELYPLK